MAIYKGLISVTPLHLDLSHGETGAALEKALKVTALKRGAFAAKR